MEVNNMEYPLMDPPFEVAPFEDMTKKEAEHHFIWYKNEIPNRIQLLKDAFERTSKKDKRCLNLKPESLKELWAWFVPRVETVPKTKKELKEEIKAAPSWLKEEIENDTDKLSLGTLTVGMDIAIYFGEVFVEEYDHLNWGFVTRPKSLAHVNRPVITGFSSGDKLDPRNVIYISTLKVAKKTDISNDALYELFQVWSERV